MNKYNFANLPTPIQKLERLSAELGKEIYVKRDDYTGVEVSGNKVRKLEYGFFEAKRNNFDTIVTIGALQSNHCRTTAALCARVGLPCYLILGGDAKDKTLDGNLFLDYMFGAEVIIVPDEEREQAFSDIEKKLISEGKKPYMIPIGASDPIGSLGYVEAYSEILAQEKDMGICFDTISIAVGSGGSYAGLFKGNADTDNDKTILGFSVDKPSHEFVDKISGILKDMGLGVFDAKKIKINDSYVGLGYAQAQGNELLFYRKIAGQEGLVLDPCYTGKAFYGLVSEIERGNIPSGRILYIHTGGILGWTEGQRNFIG